MEHRHSIAIVGGGLMGAGIAQVFAAAGHSVAVFEPDERTRASLGQRIADNLTLVGADPAPADHVTACDRLDEAVAGADFVFEAAPEQIPLKQSIFAELVETAPRQAILASNTSVIPIHRIAGGLPTAERIIGTHWWNPPYLVPLVEVIEAEFTAADTVTTMMALLTSVGKTPAHVKKDVPGFVANRLQHALWREAIAMVAEGICDAKTLDTCVKNSFGLRLAVLGPLENADLVGLDLTLDIHRTIIPELDRHAAPHDYLRARVAMGKLGFKSGEGFRTWTDDESQAVRKGLVEHLIAAQRT